MALHSELTARGSRLTTLRHLDGLTQGDVADRLNISQGFVSQIEKEARNFPLEMAQQACAEFDLPATFFSVAADVTEIGTTTFRKSSRASVRDEQHVKALFGEAARLFRLASEGSGYRTANLPVPSGEDSEEDIAGEIRTSLGLDPVEPIPNATRALERLGVGVVHSLDPLDHGSHDHHGISRPTTMADRPLVATVSEQPPAVTRMTLMHELGHLVYDRDLATPLTSTRAPEERRAYRFAGAMLIPASVVRTRVTEDLTLHGYLRIKSDYGISVGALVQRAANLRVISSQRSRSLFIQMSSQGWRTHEPVDVAAEEPRLLAQAVERSIGTDPESVAEQTGVRTNLVERWTMIDSDTSLAPVIQLRR